MDKLKKKLLLGPYEQVSVKYFSIFPVFIKIFPKISDTCTTFTNPVWNGLRSYGTFVQVWRNIKNIFFTSEDIHKPYANGQQETVTAFDANIEPECQRDLTHFMHSKFVLNLSIY